jgi:hypothetical protein
LILEIFVLTATEPRTFNAASSAEADCILLRPVSSWKFCAMLISLIAIAITGNEE